MKQRQKELLIGDAVTVLDQWIARKRRVYWEETPETIREWLLEEGAPDEMITYNRATNILHRARTNKLCSHANRGMEWIREQWRVKAK